MCALILKEHFNTEYLGNQQSVYLKLKEEKAHLNLLLNVCRHQNHLTLTVSSEQASSVFLFRDYTLRKKLENVSKDYLS